jgi:riboflavin kinase
MIDPKIVSALKQLALYGGNKEFVEISTAKLGKDLGISQQSASRRVRLLEDKGFIEIKRFGRKIWVKITKNGMDLLKREALDYRRIFEVAEKIEITGEVISGLGEGKYYIMKEGYFNQIKEKLFFEPYPGTLNIKVYARDIEKVEMLQELPGILIKGFISEGRTFGNVKAFLCTINGKDAALIIPERSHYRDVVEIISNKRLRKELDLEDGAIVDIVIFP